MTGVQTCALPIYGFFRWEPLAKDHREQDFFAIPSPSPSSYDKDEPFRSLGFVKKTDTVTVSRRMILVTVPLNSIGVLG